MDDISIPIDYQVGDVIETKDKRYSYLKVKVLDITEKGIMVQYIGMDAPVSTFMIRHSDGHLMTKCKAGTILYGNKNT